MILTPSFWPSLGGVETHVTQTTRQLVALGYDVTIVTADRAHGQPKRWFWQPTPTTDVEVRTLQTSPLKFLGLLAIWWQLLWLLPLFARAEVIHIHDVAWWFWPVRLLLPGARVVLTMHGWEGVFPIPTKLKLLKQLSATVGDKVLAIGDFIGWQYGVTPDAVSYGAVDGEAILKQIGSQAHETHQIHHPGKQLTIAYAGRLAQDTGLPLLLAAAQDQSLKHIKWLFYGDGPLRSACESVGEVRGWSADHEWLTTADVIVASGYLSVWEALLAKKPIIAVTQNQLRRDYFSAAPFGNLLLLGSTIAELRAILANFKQPHLHSQQAALQTGRQLALAQTWTHLVEFYQTWYDEVMTISALKRWWSRWLHVTWSIWHAQLAAKTAAIIYVSIMAVAALSLLISASQLPTQLRAKNWPVAAVYSRTAQFGTDTLNTLTGQLSPALQSVGHATRALHSTLVAVQSAETLMAEPDRSQPDVYQKFVTATPTVIQELGLVQQTACRSWLIVKLTPTATSTCQFFTTQPTTFWTDLAQLINYWLTDEHTLIVLLQNSQELRATGGFMGSYARIEFSGQALPTFEIGDIYEPDGQFQGLIPAPAGVDEYLSSGKGLRLPDANWQPDFPSSAQTILQYFAFGRKHGVDGAVAINLSVMQSVLEVIGPIEVPDHQVTVTADNLADVARADRTQFFPGSQQKAHFLTALAKQVQFKLSSLNRQQWSQIAQAIWQALQHKEIQAYMVDGEQQAALDRLGWTGRQTSLLATTPTAPSAAKNLDPATQPLYFMSVESNVGINKANRAINRQILLDLYPTELLVKLTITNQNQLTAPLTPTEAVNGMGYVDYHRLYLSAYLQVRSIEVAGQKLSTWHEQLIQTASGETFNQIGFVMAVPQQTEKIALISLTLNPAERAPADLTKLPGLIIQRQAGLPSTPYVLQTPTQVKQLNLTTDQLVAF